MSGSASDFLTPEQKAKIARLAMLYGQSAFDAAGNILPLFEGMDLTEEAAERLRQNIVYKMPEAPAWRRGEGLARLREHLKRTTAVKALVVPMLHQALGDKALAYLPYPAR